MDNSTNVPRDVQRKHRNDESMGWATRQRQPWSDEDDLIIVNEWLLRSVPLEDVEIQVSQRLKRSIFACQGRAEVLRAVLGCNGTASSRTTPAPQARPVCGTCFQEISPAGTCGCTE